MAGTVRGRAPVNGLRGGDGEMALFRHLGQSRREARERPIPQCYRGLYRAPTDRDAVALWGFLQSQIGIGSSARGYARLLRQTLPDVRCHAMALPGRDGVSFPSDPPERRAGRNIVVLNPPELLNGNLFFPSDLMRGTQVIGYWAWELPGMPEAWRPALDLVDEVWTCSEFAARAFRRSTRKNVRVLPHVVEGWAHLPRSQARDRLGLGTDDAFIFLSVFDFSSTLKRKNPLGVIAAFRAAFGDGPEGPLLVMKYHSGEQFAQEEAMVRAAAGRCPRIRLLSGVLTQEEMGMLFDAANCFVSLHRSEGFGLNIAEAMIAGLPVICTGYSGNMDFTRPDNSLLVDWTPVELQPGDYFGWQGQTWAEPHIAYASAAMHYVMNNPADAQDLAMHARADMERMFSPETIRTRLMALLRESEPRPLEDKGNWSWLTSRLGWDAGGHPPRHSAGRLNRLAGP